MFVKTLVTDSWQGPINNEMEFDCPTVNDVAEAIQGLDARQHTLVTLLGAGECHMAVGGGEGRYVAYVTFDNLTFYQLASSVEHQRADVQLCVGGQVGLYSSSEIVSLALALRAAIHFAETGELAPAVEWRKR